MTVNRFSIGAIRLAICAIGMILPAAAQSQAQYSRSELHTMMREASTADQYRTLTTWFRGQETIFRGKAEAENKDYEQYKTTVRTKAPTRADNARSMAAHYSNKADQMAALAVRYETQLARLDPSYRPIRAAASAAAGTPIMTSSPCPAAFSHPEERTPLAQ
ncbi:MAG: hypothetical protein ABSG25_10945 [Bryobacteraceae bacterium]